MADNLCYILFFYRFFTERWRGFSYPLISSQTYMHINAHAHMFEQVFFEINQKL